MILHKYADADTGFVIGVPVGWRVDNTGLMGSRLVILAPVPPGEFQANVNVTTQDLVGITPDEFITVTRIQLKQFAGSPQLDVDEPAAPPASGHVFAWTTHRGGAAVHGHQVAFFRGRRCYVVTASARRDQFDQLRPEFEAILGSVQFLEPEPPLGPTSPAQQSPAPPAMPS